MRSYLSTRNVLLTGVVWHDQLISSWVQTKMIMCRIRSIELTFQLLIVCHYPRTRRHNVLNRRMWLTCFLVSTCSPFSSLMVSCWSPASRGSSMSSQCSESRWYTSTSDICTRRKVGLSRIKQYSNNLDFHKV